MSQDTKLKLKTKNKKTNTYIAITLFLIFCTLLFIVLILKNTNVKSTNTKKTVTQNIETTEENLKKTNTDNQPRHNNPLPPDNKKEVVVDVNGVVKKYPNIIYRALYTPNDGSQWYLNKIQAPEAWVKSTGSSNTTVAVIDTGFALNHDELFDRWSINNNEYGGGKESNGIDDDTNGYIDDWKGWDFYNNDNNTSAGTENSVGQSVSHGTIISGLVGVAGNNDLGVSSVNWKTKILPIKAMSDDGVGYTSTIADAIRYATNRGVDVINLSLGSEFQDEYLLEQIQYAVQHGVVVVAAAGNDGCNCMQYPANYSLVLSVGATDANDNVTAFSSYGSNLDVVAPGTGTIVSSYYLPNNQQNAYTTSVSGTSISTPIVSSLAALLRGVQPTATVDDITNWIKQNTDTIAGNKAGSGRINIYKAVIAANPNLLDSLPSRSTPLFRIYKNSSTYVFTTNLDRQKNLIGNSRYSYSIEKFVEY